MKNKWLYLLALPQIVFADASEPAEVETAPPSNLEAGTVATLPIQIIEEQSGDFKIVISSQQLKNTTAAKTGKSNGQVPTPAASDTSRMFTYRPTLNQHSYYLSGEYLFWRPWEDGTDFVVRSVPNLTGSLANVGQTGTVVLGEFDWSSGGRVTAGAVFTPDYWDIRGQYTYIAPSGTKTVRPHPENTADPSFAWPTIDSFTNNDLRVARAKLSMRYQIGDLLLIKRLQMSKQILLNVAVGATGAWIDQSFIASYKGFVVQTFGQFVGVPGGFSQVRNTWHYYGGGIKTGVETDWYLGTGFSFLGNLKAALLYGRYETHSQMSFAFFATPDDIRKGWDARIREQRIVPTLQLSFGSSWGKNFSTWAINIFALYELNFWFNLQQVLYSLPEQDTANTRQSIYVRGAMGLQGLSTGMRFDF